VNYTWQITKLGLRDELNADNVLLENAIVNVKWKRVAVDENGTEASYLGNTDLVVREITAADFIALNEVTSVQVISWLEEAIEASDITRINAQLQSKIDKRSTRDVTPSW
jgi:hypothetical protein|tara:strand:- start:7052 stop:7381 length:330 start_codon:yes stop_codon:yes gene_type:complete